jgi:hypothetical protein
MEQDQCQNAEFADVSDGDVRGRDAYVVGARRDGCTVKSEFA